MFWKNNKSFKNVMKKITVLQEITVFTGYILPTAQSNIVTVMK